MESILKRINSLKRYSIADLHYCFGQGLSICHFTILFKDFVQVLLTVCIHYFKGRKFLPLIHPHVELGIEAGRESSTPLIKLVATHPQVCQYTVHCIYFMQSQKPLQVAKIMWHKNYSFIGREILFCIFILVKCY